MRIQLTVNGTRHEVDDVWEGESLLYALRERMGLPGLEERLRAGRVRLLHRLPGRACRCAPAWSRRARRRAARSPPSRGWPTPTRPAPGAAGVRRRGRGAVRLLHARPDRHHARPAGAQPAAVRPGDPGGAGRQPLPVHRLREDHGRRAGPASGRRQSDDHRGRARRHRRPATEYPTGTSSSRATGSPPSATGRPRGLDGRDRRRRPRLPAHPGLRQHPPPPLPVGDPRPRRRRHAVRVADHALPGVGPASTSTPCTPPRPARWPGWRCTGCTTSDRPPLRVPARRRRRARRRDRRGRAEVGLRFHPTRGSMDLGQSEGGLPPDNVVEDLDAILAATEAAIDRWHDPSSDSMLRIALAPCSPFSVTGELLRAVGRAGPRARRAGCTPTSPRRSTRRTSAASTSAAPRWSTWRSWAGPATTSGSPTRPPRRRAVAKMAATGTGAAHCPSSNARLGAGIARARDMRDAGARVGLGVDGAASNEAGSLLEEVRHAVLFARAKGGPTRAVGPRRAGDGHAWAGPRCSAGRRDRLDRGRQARRPRALAARHARRTPTSPTRSRRWCSARRRRWSCCWSNGRAGRRAEPGRHRRRPTRSPREVHRPCTAALLENGPS